jgi:hypothetical protein
VSLNTAANPKVAFAHNRALAKLFKHSLTGGLFLDASKRYGVVWSQLELASLNEANRDQHGVEWAPQITNELPTSEQIQISTKRLLFGHVSSNQFCKNRDRLLRLAL